MKSLRILDKKLKNHFSKYKQAIVLLGARQVGKTTILRKLFPDAKYLLVDESSIFNILETYSSDSYKSLIGNADMIFIDELHLLSNPGRAVKLIYDQLPSVKVVVTGSSSLHIKNKTAESMAGRAINYSLYPLTLGEFLNQRDIEENFDINIIDRIVTNKLKDTLKTYDKDSILENIMLYGQYPHLVNNGLDTLYLKNMVDKFIFKDIIELNLIEDRFKALELLKLLAYQIGNIINYSEISIRIGLKIETVQRYIQIFEDSFIIYRLYPYSTKARDEIGKSPKIYFWDLGIRNALIDNFDNLNIRNDSGAIFENFVINEIKKEIDYYDLNYKVNYWRLKSGSEVDLILSNNNELIACEIKQRRGEFSKAFTNRYKNAKTCKITFDNVI